MDVEEPKMWTVEDSQFIILNFQSNLLLFEEVDKVQTIFPDALAFRILYMTGSAMQMHLHEFRKAKEVDSHFSTSVDAANQSGQILAFAAFSTPYVIMWSQQHGMRASLGGCNISFLIS